jgi:hypothetical protein
LSMIGNGLEALFMDKEKHKSESAYA